MVDISVRMTREARDSDKRVSRNRSRKRIDKVNKQRELLFKRMKGDFNLFKKFGTETLLFPL